IGCVASQNGPAATLLVPGLGECLKASHPVVAIVQEVANSDKDKNAFQELDHKEMFTPVSKWVREIPCQERIEDYVDMAFRVAASGRPGPAVLLVRGDLINDLTEYEYEDNHTFSYAHYPLDRFTADLDTVEEAAEMLAKAERPLIYAGGGVISSEAMEELRAIQKDCAIPVATTTMGKGSVDETDPLSIGVIGYIMGKRGMAKFLKPMITEADVILLVGNRTNANGTDVWTMLPETAKYIHIDIDGEEIGRNYESVRLCGDAKKTLAALKKALDNQDLSKRESLRQSVADQIAKGKALHEEEIQDVLVDGITPIRIEKFMTIADELFADDQVIVLDASAATVWAANYLTAKGERKFIFPRGLAGIGWGFGLAVGAATALPDRKIFCLAGDGGFAHSWAELETARRYNMNIITVVINNEILSYQKWWEGSCFEYTGMCDLTAVDHAMIAEACGVKGIRVTKDSDIKAALEEAFAHDGPVVIDLITEPHCILPIPYMEVLESDGI
ncbi:MAG TPA: acetolactate synthase catalytic subunit, partial [Clostridiaceae bacterium]|nr:acetolactate synthase catalytic subunit [Clostridiaceae bacterium]